VRLGRYLGVEHYLGDTFSVTEVNENEFPVVAPTVDPASYGHCLADLFLAQFPAIVGS
jgi:hypothetical protein